MSNETSSRLIRCSQGHVYDASSAACPFCGEASAAQAETPPGGGGSISPSPGEDTRKNEPSRLNIKTISIASAVLLSLVSLAAGIVLFRISPPNAGDCGRPGCTGERRAEENIRRDSAPTDANNDRLVEQSDKKTIAPDSSTSEKVAQSNNENPAQKTAPPPPTNDAGGAANRQGQQEAALDQGKAQSPSTQQSGPVIDLRDPIALAFEEKYALSPLARELLATSRGYYAYDRKEFWLAKAWFTSNAAKSNPAANYWYGVMLQRGEGVQQDSAEGLRRITAAAQAGLYTAQLRLANIYLKGDYPGIAADPEKGKNWLMLAGKEERSEALKLLAELGVSHSDYEPTLADLDRALGRSYDDAYKVASKLLEQKTTAGFLWVGNFTSFGNGVPADPVRGRELMTVAARLYAPAALVNFANWSADGVRTSKNPVEAAALAYLARENAVFADEAQRIDKIIASIVGMLTAEQYQDLGFLLKGIRTLPKRTQTR